MNRSEQIAKLRKALGNVSIEKWDCFEHGVGEFVVFKTDGIEPDDGGGNAVAYVDNDIRYSNSPSDVQKAEIEFIAAANPVVIAALLDELEIMKTKLTNIEMEIHKPNELY